eukprot:5879297-Amphidinium_carterae.1
MDAAEQQNSADTDSPNPNLSSILSIATVKPQKEKGKDRHDCNSDDININTTSGFFTVRADHENGSEIHVASKDKGLNKTNNDYANKNS